MKSWSLHDAYKAFVAVPDQVWQQGGAAKQRMEVLRSSQQDLTWIFTRAWQAKVVRELRSAAFIP